ncbi:TetR/AcrR family transcriptional regulator [Streptomyces sp. NPDC052811]|uniref:TetR/AcrR family transcriptional regulator n=1 Tax=Streptomyces sp. NPDC052811 TaxID=3155731 RepID=UPI00341966F3
MQKRAEQTRQALIRATAELIADGGVHDAGLVGICRSAGVSRGALYHHFPTKESLAAAVYEQARTEVAGLLAAAFADRAPGAAAARFSSALVTALREVPTVRAGMRLGPDGSTGPTRLREEVLGLVHREMIGRCLDGREVAARDLADLAVVVTAGLESLGRTDGAWWQGEASDRIWDVLRPLFGRSAAESNPVDQVNQVVNSPEAQAS